MRVIGKKKGGFAFNRRRIIKYGKIEGRDFLSRFMEVAKRLNIYGK